MSRVREGRRWSNASTRVSVLVAVLGAIDLLFFALMWDMDAAVSGVELPVLLLALGFAVAEWRVIHVQFRAQASSFSLLEIPLVIGLLYVSPRLLMAEAMVGIIFGLVLARKQSVIKLLFNVVNIGFYCGVSSLILHVFIDSGDLNRLAWLAVFLATAVGSTLSVGSIIGAITLTEGPPDKAKIVELVSFSLVVGMANTALGLVAAMLDGFYVAGFFSALFGALIVSLVSTVASWTVGPDGRYEILIVERRQP